MHTRPFGTPTACCKEYAVANFGSIGLMKRESWSYVAAVLSGVLVWIVVSAVSGRREAWDSSWYFLVGYPLICAVALALGYLAPVRSWRWGLAPFVGQFVWLLLTQGPGNLLPLGIIVFGVIALPAVIAARIGAYFGNRQEKRSEPQ